MQCCTVSLSNTKWSLNREDRKRTNTHTESKLEWSATKADMETVTQTHSKCKYITNKTKTFSNIWLDKIYHKVF